MAQKGRKCLSIAEISHSYRKGVAESNGVVRIISESSEIGVSAHAP